MQVYQTNEDGYFVGVTHAEPNQLEEGEWLIPGGCVTVEPPSFAKGKCAKWDGKKWQVLPVPKPKSEEEPSIAARAFNGLLKWVRSK